MLFWPLKYQKEGSEFEEDYECQNVFFNLLFAKHLNYGNAINAIVYVEQLSCRLWGTML